MSGIQSKIDTVKDEEGSYSDESIYNISSFGTDLSFREVITMYDEGDLEKPELQRKYVWSKNEASRFIDSLLLGLPVPSIFLAKTSNNKRLIVDGYQRIMTVYDFVKGIFSGDGKVFKLSNSDNINENWRGKAYQELSDDQKRIIRTSPIHAIVFEQKQPCDDTGMYQIFERINTSGRVLKPQEIRNCVYHGKFNSLLFELNKLDIWRKIVGDKEEDSRMADVELILRFYAFVNIAKSEEIKQTQINLSKYLNTFMGRFCNIDNKQKQSFTNLFVNTMTELYNLLGDKLFKTTRVLKGENVFAQKINPVVLDAVCTSTAFVLDKYDFKEESKRSFIKKYIDLLENEEFIKVTTQRTTNINNIKARINIATKILYGVKYEW